MPHPFEAQSGGLECLLATTAESEVVVSCSVIDEALVKAAVCWLAMQAKLTRLDAVIVIPSVADADCLECELPAQALGELVAGNLVRMNDVSLQLLAAHEVMPRARPHNVVLSIGLNASELARVHRMNPAASFVVSTIRWKS